MNATAVERIKQPETEHPTTYTGFFHIYRVSRKVGFFALVGIGIVLSVVLALSKVALDAATRLCWHILDDSLGQVGNLRRHLDHFSLYLWLNLRFAAKNIDLVDGESFFNKAFKHPVDASRTINVVVSRNCWYLRSISQLWFSR